MTKPMSTERLAEIRERAESVKTWKGYHAEPVPQLLDVDVPALLAEVKRARKALHNGRAERDRLRTEHDRLAEEIRKAAAYLIRRADLGATLCPSECRALADDLLAALGGTEAGR